MAPERQYELVIFGATGYTGVYCAEHVVKHLPTDLKWAVAGRSASKLEKLVADISKLNSDRVRPGIELCSLSPKDLDALAQKTKCLVSTVGPYHLYGTPVVEACVMNGTHYLDVTGETPWVKQIIEKYDDAAKQNKAIIIPECGVESAPSDLLAYSLATYIRTTFSAPTKSVTASLHDLKAGFSGGTLLTILTVLDTFSISEIVSSMKPYSLASRKPAKTPPSPPLLTRLFGVRKIPELGTVTTAIAGTSNALIVQRTWSLSENGDFYGQNFSYEEVMRVSSAFKGVVAHLAITIAPVFLLISPLMWLVKKFIPAPGQGPSLESTRNNFVEMRALGVSDSSPARKALARFRFDGSMYDLTARLAVEGAYLLARGDLPEFLKGGCLTPAMLGQAYLERMAKAGVGILVDEVQG